MTISISKFWGGMGGCGFVLDRLQPLTVQRVRAAGKESNPTNATDSRPRLTDCRRCIPP